MSPPPHLSAHQVQMQAALRCGLLMPCFASSGPIVVGGSEANCEALPLSAEVIGGADMGGVGGREVEFQVH